MKILSKFLIIVLVLNLTITPIYPAFFATLTYAYEADEEGNPVEEAYVEESAPEESASEEELAPVEPEPYYVESIPDTTTQDSEVSQDASVDSFSLPPPLEEPEPAYSPEDLVTAENQQGYLVDYSSEEDEIFARKERAWVEKREQAAQEAKQAQEVTQTIVEITDDIFEKSGEMIARTGTGLSNAYSSVYEDIVKPQEEAQQQEEQERMLAELQETEGEVRRSEEQYRQDLEAALNAPEEEKVKAMREALKLPEGGFDDDQVQNIFKEAASGAGIEIEGDFADFTLSYEKPTLLSSEDPEISATRPLEMVKVHSPCIDMPEGEEKDACEAKFKEEDREAALNELIMAGALTGGIFAVATSPIWIPVAAAGAAAAGTVVSTASLTTYVYTTSAGAVLLANSPRVVQTGVGILAQNSDVVIPAATWGLCQTSEDPRACIQENLGPIPQITELVSSAKSLNTVTKTTLQVEKDLDFAANTAIKMAAGDLGITTGTEILEEGVEQAAKKGLSRGLEDVATSSLESPVGMIKEGIEGGNRFYKESAREYAQEMQEFYGEVSQALKQADRLNSEAEADLVEIAASGSLGGQEIFTGRVGDYFLRTSMNPRKTLMDIYTQDPELARKIVEDGVAVGHGSTSGSLLGILDDGIKPMGYLEAQGSLVSTGEGVFGAAGINQEYASFTPWSNRDVLMTYSKGSKVTEEALEQDIAVLKKSLEEEVIGAPRASVELTIRNEERTLEFLRTAKNDSREILHDSLIRDNFPVVYLANNNISGKGIEVADRAMEGEIAIKGGIETKDISTILVPQDKIELVRKQIERRGLNINIFAIESFGGAK